MSFIFVMVKLNSQQTLLKFSVSHYTIESLIYWFDAKETFLNINVEIICNIVL